MDKSIEIFHVSKCPHCLRSHKYLMTVLRSPYMYGASGSDLNTEKCVRRLFTCPKNGMDFEGFVILQDNPKNKIISVTVGSIIEEVE